MSENASQQNTTFPSGNGTAHGYLALPPSGSGPGVLVIQEWWGLTDQIAGVCDRLAGEGRPRPQAALLEPRTRVAVRLLLLERIELVLQPEVAEAIAAQPALEPVEAAPFTHRPAGALDPRPLPVHLQQHRPGERMARLVAEAAQPGQGVHAVARRHGVCSSLLYRWRRDGVGAQWSAAPTQRLIPVQVAAEHREAPAPSRPEAVRIERLVEISLPNGCSVRVDQHIDGKALRRILAALRG